MIGISFPSGVCFLWSASSASLQRGRRVLITGHLTPPSARHQQFLWVELGSAHEAPTLGLYIWREIWLLFVLHVAPSFHLPSQRKCCVIWADRQITLIGGWRIKAFWQRLLIKEQSLCWSHTAAAAQRLPHVTEISTSSSSEVAQKKPFSVILLHWLTSPSQNVPVQRPSCEAISCFFLGGLCDGCI